MAAFRLVSGCLRPSRVFSLLSSSSKGIVDKINNAGFAVNIRNMSSHGPRKMEIGPTRIEWRKFKDHFHFYILLGAIPCIVVITAVNVFIGPAELAEIPEGYEPKHWEYYKHPISRFIARHIESPQHKYERHLHFVGKEMEVMNMRKLEDRVGKILDSPGIVAHKTWYFVPRSADPVRAIREDSLKSEEEQRYFDR